MQIYLRLASRLLPVLLSLLIPLRSAAQSYVGEPQNLAKPPKGIERVLKTWELYRLQPLQMKQYLRANGNTAEMHLRLGAHDWVLHLQPSQILSPDYALQVLTDEGLEKLPRTDDPAFKGYEEKSGGQVRLTLDKDFIHGFIEEGTERYYIEPLWYHEPTADRDLFLFYPVSAVIRDHEATCMEVAAEEDGPELNDPKGNLNVADMMGCYILELAIASDKSMFNKYGTTTAVQNHNIAVINDVQGDYTGSFTHDLQFNIVTQFIVTGTDPWTSSTDAGTLLASFAQWGNANNFGVTFDVGELWTNRDFDGPTVGIAYLQGVCNSNKYHCLQDFTTNSEYLRCMTSHELGHNFSAVHDPTSGSCPPDYIMCPFVSSATNWSSASQSSIGSYMQSKINSGCLGPCSSGPPLTADFDWNPDPPCQNQAVQFTDMSSGNITSRQWVFPSGTPPTSTAQNPIVTWSTPGQRNVTLTVFGPSGSASTTKSITVQPVPTANFTYSFSGLTYTFISTSTNATSYLWDFGDGGASTDQNPVYTYPQAGIYTVKLTVENPCGTSVKTVLINTVPTADFSANPTSGCAPFVVQMTNESSTNATSWVWQFPGGSPASSSQKDPVVLYSNSGTYTVTLTAFNVTGSSSTTKTGYITVQNIPSSNFTFTTNGLTVTFTNTSFGANSSSWNFGDGNTSTQTNPTHTYASGGTYTVTLTSTNPCGSTTSTKVVSLAVPPTAGFTATPTSGCGPLTVQFTNTSTGNPTSFNWAFPGGSPSSSTAQNPVVVYNTPGSYSVTLTATNSNGSNTATQTNFIVVNPNPTAGFNSTVHLDTAFFNNTSQNATSYNWSFGDGQSSTAQNPVHVYANDGTYTVTLLAINICDTSVVTQTVVIATPPTAGFTASPTSGCGPLTVQFTNTSSANATNFNWTFPGGDPTSSTAQNPVVVYNTPGTYSVSLTVSNSAGSNTATQTNFITVNPGPTAGFTSNINLDTVAFTNVSQNANTYNWDFGDNQTSTAPNPVHVYAADGTYTVTLTATNACGTNTYTQTVVIVTPPTAGFTASPTSGCGPLSVQFTNTSSANATSFNWAFPGGDPSSSTAQNPVVVYSTAGTYTVTLTVSNGAGSNTATQTNYITVNVGPSAGFTSAVNGATATFTNTSNNATSYSWAFGDNQTSAEQNPTHTYANDGTYTVILTATNPCGTSTFTQTVVIATPPTAGFTATPTTGCGPLTVQFTSTSSVNATSFNWAFPGGTPSSSTEQNPLVTYNAPGAYSVTLTVSNSAGSNTATQTNFVLVNAAPTAGFSSTTSGATATFTNTSSNGNSYSWNFGDGGSSTEQNPSHTYTSDGTFTVTLTVTNPCGTATYSQPVVILTSPVAGFTANVTTGCGPLTVHFQDLSSGNTTGWEWSFPGGTPASSTEQNPTIIYNTPGTYDVTLVASSGTGTNTFTQPGFIKVLPLPAPAFSAAPNGTTVAFANTSQNATTYFWDFGDNSNSSETDPVHTYSADGVYTVTLTATNNCGSVTTTQVVTIVTPPTAAFTPSTTQGCIPLKVTFENQSSANATSFEWTFAGGNPGSSTEANPTVTWSQPGTYAVTLVATNAAGTATATTSIQVQGPPSSGFSVQLAGLSVVLTNTSSNANGYLWSFGDGGTSTETNPTHTYTATGSYTIVLKAFNDCDTSTSFQLIEIVGSAPLAAFSAEEVKGCVPMTVHFADQSAGNPNTWQWTFPGGMPNASTEQNPTIVYPAPGSYTVSLQVTNPFGSNSLTLNNYIEVIDVPTAAFSFAANQTTVTFSNQSANGTNYIWNFGDGNTSTETNPTHTYANPGTYTVELTAINNCGASTLQQTFTLLSATGETPWLEKFRLYPNPTSGAFTVEMAGDPQAELEFVLYNTLGQLAKRETVEFGTGNMKRAFDFSALPAGMYTLRIRSGVRSMEVKVAIQR